MSLKAELGRAIRHHRERTGLTQLQLGEAIGRSLQAVGNIERGKSFPELETLEAIAHALDTPVREFFPREDPKSEDAMERILARVTALSPGEREWLDAVLAAILRRPEAQRRIS
ncbi:DNA-binding transcriptional regulator, XRE-family HTH domain [Tistlia consotensis]|uniref:DNA-binding transcriptional regulator, XRE-family HTH domain n=1 Tax=Tistlia consotensis USBA 355 TaxID=560819 RepID=A0A1Y6CS80_9PROT|nr:helix-turn-helix domain-containing protein [Tistlia consotensis]SMF84126.1 DNA-binding transcriptional regulator, XRE-family HTH domain [Tistlia consotensis USBA 355]SNS35929.1 DNA-binding transcriptional regulator, XRE-family HTH domain [Tistlia consotensis]